MVSFGLHDVVECGYDPKVVTKALDHGFFKLGWAITLDIVLEEDEGG